MNCEALEIPKELFSKPDVRFEQGCLLVLILRLKEWAQHKYLEFNF